MCGTNLDISFLTLLVSCLSVLKVSILEKITFSMQFISWVTNSPWIVRIAQGNEGHKLDKAWVGHAFTCMMPLNLVSASHTLMNHRSRSPVSDVWKFHIHFQMIYLKYSWFNLDTKPRYYNTCIKTNMKMNLYILPCSKTSELSSKFHMHQELDKYKF